MEENTEDRLLEKSPQKNPLRDKKTGERELSLSWEKLGARIFHVDYELEAVGMDVDGEIKPLNELSHSRLSL